MLHRRELVRFVLADRPDSLLAVASLGSPAWDLTAAGDHPANFCFVGAMGQASPFALGLAMARPEKRIVLFAGDGELLMGLGALTTIATRKPPNLAIVILDNGAYLETGGQPTATGGCANLELIGNGCGIETTATIDNQQELETIKPIILEQPGPVLVVARIRSEKTPLALPRDLDGVTAINSFRSHINPS